MILKRTTKGKVWNKKGYMQDRNIHTLATTRNLDQDTVIDKQHSKSLIVMDLSQTMLIVFGSNPYYRTAHFLVWEQQYMMSLSAYLLKQFRDIDKRLDKNKIYSRLKEQYKLSEERSSDHQTKI